MTSARIRSVFRAVVIFFVFAGVNNSALAAGADEYQVKAAFIYKFCLYIDFPANAFADENSPLLIAVAGPSEIATNLREVTQGRKINGRVIAIARSTDSDVSALQVLYISASEMSAASKLIARLRGTHTLLITESPSGTVAGSVINFAMQDNRVRFDIDLDAASQRGLHVGAQLLQVARSVQKGDSP